MPSSERQADARAAFEHWASLQPKCPRNIGSLVEDVERSDDHVGLLSTEVRGRNVRWKSVAFGGKARITFPVIKIESVDAWSVDPAALQKDSDHIAQCDACAGAGKARCKACNGAGTTVCGKCGGQRKIYGYAVNGSRRLLNCQSCRGKGEIDCPQCRRGISVCSDCDGNGRVQRWIELEVWHRSIATEHPGWMVRQFSWNPNPPNEIVARDASILVDIDRPHRLAPADVGNIPPQWLTQLAPALQPGERIAQQRLRIARTPTHTIRYRLGGETDGVPFTGHRLIAPPSNPLGGFAQRASKLRRLGWLLLLILCVILLFSFARGPFYWNVPTLLSSVAAACALVSIYGGIAEWTAARRRMHRWWLAASSCAILGIAFAIAAMPRSTHIQLLLADGKLDAAEQEANALGENADARTWANLRLARIRLATDVAAARELLAQIPHTLPQHALAADATGRLFVHEAAGRLREKRWSDAADAIVAARALGVAATRLTPLSDAINAAGLDAATSAAGERDVASRLRQRIAAEAILVAWERAADDRGTPPLIALRTSMARDVATLEKAARRRAS